MASPLTRQIKRIEKRELKGEIGRWRKDFCTRYPNILNQVRDNTSRSFLETISLKQKQITCRKGCAHCCHHYVTVSVAQGIAIVDYLYGKKKWLIRFLDKYEIWHKKGNVLSDRIDRLRLSAQAAKRPGDAILQDTRPLSEQYFKTYIPCPFLENGSCFIYAVRPLSCSGHFSTSPPDCCAPESRGKPDLHNVIPDDPDLLVIANSTDHRLVMYELTLPVMVYRLLTEGSSAMMDEVVRHDV